jgi:hypothetical protein
VPRQARWARFGRQRALRSERLPSAERPRGSKVGRLVVDPRDGQGRFLGLTVGGLYTSDAEARCEVLDGRLPPPRRWGRRVLPAPHAAPELGCTYGFHAFNAADAAVDLLAERPPASRLFGAALLEVDLAGTVIEFDRGFRAGRQRVLGVQVPRWCVPCAADGRARRAERMAGYAGARLESGLRSEVPRVPSAYRLAVAVHHASLLERLAGRAALRPVCDEHTPPDDGAASADSVEVVVLGLAELAGRLATEVRWLADGRFDVAGFVEALSWLPAPHRPAA